jgi:hypothetical protein
MGSRLEVRTYTGPADPNTRRGPSMDAKVAHIYKSSMIVGYEHPGKGARRELVEILDSSPTTIDSHRIVAFLKNG